MQGSAACICYQYKALPMLTGMHTFFSCSTSIPLSVISVTKTIVKMM